MKKIIAIILSAAFLCTFCGCEPENIPEPENSAETSETVSGSDNHTETEAFPETDIFSGQEESSYTNEMIKDLDLNALAGENLSCIDVCYFGGDTVCASFKRTDSEKGISILFIDIDKERITGRFDSENSRYCIMRCEGGYTFADLSEESSEVYEIKSDGTYRLTDYSDMWEAPHFCGSHRIIWDNTGTISGSLVDEETGDVLVKSLLYYDENGEKIQDCRDDVTYSFSFAIDDHRFTYTANGYDWTAGIGIYDFDTKTAQLLPGTEYCHCLGVSGNILYYFPSNEKNIFAIDINTFETKLVTELPYIAYSNYRSYDGKIIGILMYDDDGQKTNLLIDTENGGIIHDIPSVSPDRAFISDSFICKYNNSTIYMMNRNKFKQ